jgi:hypothetical protein
MPKREEEGGRRSLPVPACDIVVVAPRALTFSDEGLDRFDLLSVSRLSLEYETLCLEKLTVGNCFTDAMVAEISILR